MYRHAAAPPILLPPMKARIQSAILSLVILSAGVVLGLWLAERPLPPLGFLGARPHPGEVPPPPPHLTPEQRQAFDRALTELQPQVEAFQKGFTSLQAAYHTRMNGILTETQRAKRTPMPEIDWVGDFNLLARARIGEPIDAGLPGMQDDADHARSLYLALLRIIMYEPSLRIVTDKYQLTPDQQVQVRAAMEERRAAFLKLAQENPLPVDRIYALLRDLGLLAPSPHTAGP